MVGFAEGGVAGVEVGRGGFGGEDADAWGEDSIEGAEEVGGGDRNVEREGGDLAESVNAGVGAAGALGEGGFAGDVVERRGEGSLNAGEVGLDLPATIGCAVVAEGEFPEGHGLALDGNTEEVR